MNDLDKKTFAELMVCNGEIYNKEVSKTLMQTYFTTLKDYSVDEIKNGLAKHAVDPKHGSFFPKPADIVRHLQTNKLSTEQKAELAWAQITQCLRVNGSYGGLKIEDKQAIAALKSFTTWKDFCMMDITKQTWAKKEFISMYSTYENTPVEMLPNSLPGLVELHNHKAKYAEKSMQSMSNILDGINKHRLNKE